MTHAQKGLYLVFLVSLVYPLEYVLRLGTKETKKTKKTKKSKETLLDGSAV